ncbi:MAG: hypothetical protein ACT4PM_01305 [Gemmatimonadales bacterium]
MTEATRSGRRRVGPALLVLMTAGLAGFIAQGEFAPTIRAALGFVVAVFAVTFLVSLAHTIWGAREIEANKAIETNRAIETDGTNLT